MHDCSFCWAPSFFFDYAAAPLTSPSFCVNFALNGQFICVKLGCVCVTVCVRLHKESTLARSSWQSCMQLCSRSRSSEKCFHFNLQSLQNLISSTHCTIDGRRREECLLRVHKYLITLRRKGMHSSCTHTHTLAKCVL